MNKIYKAMRERTEEEKFWISCGLKKKKHPKGNWFMWYSPQGKFIGNAPPSTDSVDDLFKYAVPVAIERLMRDKSLTYQRAIRYLFQAWFIELRDSTKYAQALYLVLQKVLGGER